VVTMGAGDVYRVADAVSSRLTGYMSRSIPT
jgi:hypothetical protein